MAFDRVIQDSDDDEEPSPPKTTRIPITNDAPPPGPESIPAQQEVDHDSHIAVNFDQFLQSQDAPQIILSPAQQRREERWIPPVDGQVGSMRTMMAEIGLAQRRLFDDDHQAAYGSDNQPIQFQEPDFEPAHVESIDEGYMAKKEALVAKHAPITPAHEPVPRLELHGATSTEDWSQSEPSYNIFDSSNHTPSNQLNRADFICDSGITMLIEPMQNFEARWRTSMQGSTSSPHDTEPFSSVISPKAFRAKSDNIAPNTIQPSPSVDELALFATIEMPKIEKRGRKKKQSLPVNDEGNELLHATPHETSLKKPEKRKPGRPPKAAKADAAVFSERSGALSHPSGSSEIAETPHALPSETAVQDYIVPLQIFPAGHLEDPGILPHEAKALEQDMQPPPKPKKEPGKKKVKRSKTTSVTLTKTFEPDVEDDVIWIDERPIVSGNQEEPLNPGQAELALDLTRIPKKRGRKRKKTAEQLEREAEAQLQAEAAVNPETSDDTHQKPAVSVVLDNRSRAQTPNITHPNLGLGENALNEPQISEPALPEPTSPSKELSNGPVLPPETPEKTTDPKTPSNKGPGKHSPISSTCKVPYRVGLSKRARIAPLLKIIKR
ncbi:hypothetical protein BJX64DRAFT_271557 [Aspergillus heterothallicus]